MERFREYGTPGNLPPPQPGGGLPQNQPPGYPPQYAPPPPEDMGTGKIVGLSALACCIPGLGPLISLIIGIVERAKKGAVVVIVISAIMLLLAVPILAMIAAIALPVYLASAPESVQQEFEEVMGGTYAKVKDKAREAEVKQNLHMIQLAVERHATDHDGDYPDTIDKVIQNGYLDVFPDNPFNDGSMQVVNWTDAPEVREGNFIFELEYVENVIVGYTLYGFGSVNTIAERAVGDSLDPQVVIILSSGLDTSRSGI